MNRRQFMAACSAALSPGVLRANAPRQPNILFVFADQLRSMELGCYGGEQVRTPMMDRLAREGVLFTHAFSTYPVCSPFRAMLVGKRAEVADKPPNHRCEVASSRARQKQSAVGESSPALFVHPRRSRFQTPPAQGTKIPGKRFFYHPPRLE